MEDDSDLEIAARGEKGRQQEEDEDEEEATTVQEKFGLKGINNEPRILQRLAEIRANFYNRLSS